ncbi:polysaccharide biosynthesis protein [Reichenbachiella carrageenanivorans]|uniref:Polysaccharide biosynthesis protein n=1 Tax=Reichenbachiella carrageenanivorans TaxID=2979869 RepID=A0ABY6D4Q5_9BACT|nr:polysaccharide biosynthesis protein [Reichenbachiella carrageenanivorans]UXX81116.1 polysaccharide biosynthesis protein [Reichenbachiella carrageenanivorans]
MLNHQSIFITGGTGTLGSAFLHKILATYPQINTVTIYSRDEMKQYELRRRYPSVKYPMIRWVIGDIRDQERLHDKMKGADLVIHAAAMKHIPICEENPEECLKTNVTGTKNVIHAALDNNVKQTILCSTDKSVDPISIYGNSKQAAEKLFLNASNEHSKFAIIRLGNIWGSRGSVVPLFKEIGESGKLPITHPNMSRFFCTEEQMTDSLFYTLETMQGGEIVIPKMIARKITDIAREIAPNATHQIVGLRGFEKISEKLVSDIELPRTSENAYYWIINSSAPSTTQIVKDARELDSQYASKTIFNYLLN